MSQRLRLEHSAVHYRAVTSYLNHHCQGFSWFPKASGLLRARKIEDLLKLAEDVKCRLADSSFLDDYTGNSSNAGAVFGLANQFVAMVNKYPYDMKQRPDQDPDGVAVSSFLKAERRNKRLNAIFRGYRVRGLWRHRLHPTIADTVWRVLGDKPNFESIYDRCDFSGGASVLVRGNATHIGRKLGEPLSTTPSCTWHVRRAMRHNAQLRDFAIAREGLAFDACDAGPPDKMGRVDRAVDTWTYPVQHNEICCVPKNSETSRTVALEPTGNTLIQKGFDLEMRELLRERLNIDLSNQDENGLMAYEGSLPDALDPYVTLDVKDASNSILTELVRYYCPPEWFTAMNEVRSPMGRLPDGTFHRYQLFCTMGNGFCFPLETLIFAACCVAAYRDCGLPCDFRVYGDDIIVRQSVALLVVEVLKSNGFRLNGAKSFIFGPFRESCGANWYEGTGVTPVYWRTRITSRSALHAIHNAHTKHPDVQGVIRGFDPDLPFVVPETKMYDHITDQAFRVPMDVCMTSKSVVWRRDTMSWRFSLLVSSSINDDTYGTHLTGEAYRELRWLNALRGAKSRSPFPLRRLSRWYPVRAQPDSKLECAIAPQVGRVSWFWGADAICALQLLKRGGHRQPYAVMREWYPR